MTTQPESDILVLGATGFTGTLITKYLAAHLQRKYFRLALGARSLEKLKGIAEKLNLTNDVKLVKVDVTQPYDELETIVKKTKVVINTVGPYWLYGTPVVRACARNGVHYVDLAGETAWLTKVIPEYDSVAAENGSIIVPACGFDSIPADISAYLANKTLKNLSLELQPGTSTSAYQFDGSLSGGTLNSIFTEIEKIPSDVRASAKKQYTLSPLVGVERKLGGSYGFLHKMAIPGSKSLTGTNSPIAGPKYTIVHRSFGLLEVHAKKSKDSETTRMRYGPQFTYNEFMVTGNAFSALFITCFLSVAMGILRHVKPVRSVLKIVLPKPGEGPSQAKMENGFFKVLNMTSSTSSPPVHVKTIINGRGDPGYLLTAIMISESALSFLLPPASQSATINGDPGAINTNIHALTPLARQGGMLTPMTAFGDVLIQRLEESGRFEISSSVVSNEESSNNA